MKKIVHGDRIGKKYLAHNDRRKKFPANSESPPPPPPPPPSKVKWSALNQFSMGL
jgi:hypothetical protein